MDKILKFKEFNEAKEVKISQSAGIAIIRDKKMLMIHPAKSPWFKSYGIPKGGIDSEESEEEAAIRETFEEVGIKIGKKQLGEKGEFFYDKNGKINKRVVYFVVEIKELAEIGLTNEIVPKTQLQLKEVDWAGFLGLEEAEKRCHPKQLDLLKYLK